MTKNRIEYQWYNIKSWSRNYILGHLRNELMLTSEPDILTITPKAVMIPKGLFIDQVTMRKPSIYLSM